MLPNPSTKNACMLRVQAAYVCVGGLFSLAYTDIGLVSVWAEGVGGCVCEREGERESHACCVPS